ncbi:MAG TPA: cysteine hydrolase family protein [Gemmatimonadales bacterium]|nr:cysteine hydrolase family protein [Gemmatimonadales bacterium]
MATDLIFWDVDTQYDFMRADGKLYVPGSEEIIPTVGRLTDHAHAHGIPIVASADDHVAGDRELSETPDFRETFPPHCIRGTPGQRKIAETALRNPLEIPPEPAGRELREAIRAHDGDFLLLKRWFDVFTNANVDLLLDELAPRRIVLYGVALDVCDRYAIEGLLSRFQPSALSLVADAARAIDASAGDALLTRWRGLGVNIVSAEDVLENRASA